MKNYIIFSDIDDDIELIIEKRKLFDKSEPVLVYIFIIKTKSKNVLLAAYNETSENKFEHWNDVSDKLQVKYDVDAIDTVTRNNLRIINTHASNFSKLLGYYVSTLETLEKGSVYDLITDFEFKAFKNLKNKKDELEGENQKCYEEQTELKTLLSNRAKQYDELVVLYNNKTLLPSFPSLFSIKKG